PREANGLIDCIAPRHTRSFATHRRNESPLRCKPAGFVSRRVGGADRDLGRREGDGDGAGEEGESHPDLPWPGLVDLPLLARPPPGRPAGATASSGLTTLPVLPANVPSKTATASPEANPPG